MASEQRIRANRENALRSTGPRTDEGKAAVRFNALKHGLLAEAALLPNEDGAELQRLIESVHAELGPVGEVETQLTDRIVSCLWRLRRVIRVEAGLFVKEMYSEIANRADSEASGFQITEADDRLRELVESWEGEKRITDAERHSEALQRAREAREIAEGEMAALGAAFMRDAAGPDAFSKLARYEARIEKALFVALAALQSLQAERMRTPAAPAVAVAALPSGATHGAASDDVVAE